MWGGMGGCGVKNFREYLRKFELDPIPPIPLPRPLIASQSPWNGQIGLRGLILVRKPINDPRGITIITNF